MFKEYDVVVARRNINHEIKSGCEGTIVFNPARGPKGWYLVEFFDDDKKSIDVVEVQEQDIALL